MSTNPSDPEAPEAQSRESLYYWVDTKIGCAGVTVSPDGTIIDAAPIYRVFIGQPFENLINWSKTVKVVYLPQRASAPPTPEPPSPSPGSPLP